MAKRRKRGGSNKTRDEEDEPEDKKPAKSTKSKGRKRSSRNAGIREVNSKREAILVFGIAAILIGALLGYYIYYIYMPGLEDEDDESSGSSVTYGVKLEVINQETHNFGTSSFHIAQFNDLTYYCLLITNTGKGTDSIFFKTSQPPDRWAYNFDQPGITSSDSGMKIVAGGAEVVIMTVAVPDSGSTTARVTAYSTEDNSKSSTVEVRTEAQNLGEREAQFDDHVYIYYTLVDRGTDSEYNENIWKYNPQPTYEFDFTIGTGVIEGFSDMALGMKEGETRVAKIPGDKCYGSNPSDGKPDGDLVYEMYMKTISG